MKIVLKASYLPLLLLLLLVLVCEFAQAKEQCHAKHKHKHNHKSHRKHTSHHKGHHPSHSTHAGSSSSHHASSGSSASNAPSSSSSSSRNNDSHVPISSSSHRSSSSSSSSSPPDNKTHLTPGGRKAGIAGGDSLTKMRHAISWMTTWTPDPYPGTQLGHVEFASMCWGIGETAHDDDAKRFEEFKKVPHGKYKYVIGFNEADFQGDGSSGVIAPKKAAQMWEQYIAPHGKKGSVLVSPSCAKQQDEDWLGPFLQAVQTQPDVINVHIFKNKASEIKTVLDHYAKYNKPMWVTELACIDYANGNHAFCSQDQTDTFLQEAVKLLEADDRVAAYAWSDAYNGPSCKLTNNGQLSHTGQLLSRVYSSIAKRSMLKRGGFART